MFTNFFYIITALLIYTTYQPTDSTNFNAIQSFCFFLLLILLYAGASWYQFERLYVKLNKDGRSLTDSRFSYLLARQSILAICVFATGIYAFNLSSFLYDVWIFRLFPTLLAIFFISLFLSLFVILWVCAYKSYRITYSSRVGYRSYVTSNISIAMPVLLPWVIISGMADLIQILPFTYPKQFLSTTTGEIIYFLFFLVCVAMVSPLLIKNFWRCRPLDKGLQRDRIESLCHASDMGYRDILYWPIFEGCIITAGVMGLVRQFRYILVTRALLNMLEPNEVDAVIAHEIGHIKHRHLIFYLFFFVGYMVITFSLLNLIVYAMIYLDPLMTLFGRVGINTMTFSSLIFSLLIITTFLIYFRFVFGYFMRNFERQADAYVFTMFDTSTALIRTLEKIGHTGRQPADKPNWHHFSIKERIQFLMLCEEDRAHIKKHARKIKKSVGVYLGVLTIMGIAGYQLNYGQIGTTLSSHVLETAIVRELQKKPTNPDLFATVADFYYHQRNYSQAVMHYENAIAIVPEHVRALNNLAWLYATCEDMSFRNPERALYLALLAASVKEEAHILDTLAESYFVNGDVEAAILTSNKALSMAKGDKQYYEDQIRRFAEALENNSQ